MRPVQPGDVRHLLAGGRIHHDDMIAARDIQQLRLRIDGHIIPPAIATNLQLIHNVIRPGPRALTPRRSRAQ